VLTSSATVAPGAQSILTDVVGQLNGSGNGALEVVSDQGVVVGSRTYDLVSASAACTPSGTFGQDYDGSTSTGLLGTGVSAYLPQLRENAAFRTNIAFTNTGTAQASLSVDLYDGAGVRLTTFTVSVPAGGYLQETRPFAKRAGRSDLDAAYAKVTVTAGNGVLVSASVIDNVTNDPTTMPMLSEVAGVVTWGRGKVSRGK